MLRGMTIQSAPVSVSATGSGNSPCEPGTFLPWLVGPRTHYQQGVISVLGVFFFIVCYWMAGSFLAITKDDVMMISAARMYGVKSLLTLHADTWYPVATFAAWCGNWGPSTLALLAGIGFCVYAIRLFGPISGTLLACLTLLVSSRRPDMALGHAAHLHWLSLVFVLLFLIRPVFRRYDYPLFTLLAANGGVCGLAAPFFLLFRRNIACRKACMALLAGLLIQLIARVTLSANPDSVNENRNRDILFNLPIYSQAVAIQSFYPLAASFDQVRELSFFLQRDVLSVRDVNPSWFWRALGFSSLGWMLLLFFPKGPGWRYGAAVILISMVTFSISMIDSKVQMLIFPDHGHYVSWIGICLAQSAFLIICHYIQEKMVPMISRFGRDCLEPNLQQHGEQAPAGEKTL